MDIIYEKLSAKKDAKISKFNKDFLRKSLLNISRTKNIVQWIE